MCGLVFIIICAGIVKAVILPAATVIGGDLLKYGIDNAQKFFKGEKVDDFDLSRSLKNAAFDVVWKNLPGKYVYDRFDDILKKADSKSPPPPHREWNPYYADSFWISRQCPYQGVLGINTRGLIEGCGVQCKCHSSGNLHVLCLYVEQRDVLAELLWSPTNCG